MTHETPAELSQFVTCHIKGSQHQKLSSLSTCGKEIFPLVEKISQCTNNHDYTLTEIEQSFLTNGSEGREPLECRYSNMKFSQFSRMRQICNAIWHSTVSEE